MHRAFFLAVVLVFSGLATSASTYGQTLSRMSLATTDAESLASRLEREGFDVLPVHPQSTRVDVIASVEEVRALIALGLSPVKVASGRPLREILRERGGPEGPPAGYHDLAAVNARLAQAAADHPTICQLVDLTATYGTPPTFEGRHLMAVKISDSVALDEDEPAVLFVSCHHARELISPVIALEAIDRLTDDYGIVSSVTAAVDGHEIWIAPVWNPDGYEHVFAVDDMWRKNRRVFSNGTGVDQNRNYPHGWDNACSGSTTPSSQTYKGPSPASESETQTLLALAVDRRFAKVVDFHSRGREVLWGYDCSTHPFDGFYQNEATALSTAAGYQGSERRPSADGEHQQWHLGRQGALSYLIETATEFQPPYADALLEAGMVWGAIEWTLARNVPLWGHVTDSCTGAPVEATITPVGISLTPAETNSSGGCFGRYHYYLPAGSYSLRFEAPGYVALTLPVAVGSANSTTLDVQLDPVGGGGSVANYCVSAPNSVGAGATISQTGSVSVSANDFHLHAVDLPANQFAVFLYGLNPTQAPLYDGFRCVGSPVIRLPLMVTDPQGLAELPLDFANPPVSSGQITPGSTWNFQFFYRDPAFGGTMANLTNGLRVGFCQ